MLTIKGINQEIDRLERQREVLSISNLFDAQDKILIHEYFDILAKYYKNAVNKFFNKQANEIIVVGATIVK